MDSNPNLVARSLEWMGRKKARMKKVHFERTGSPLDLQGNTRQQQCQLCINMMAPPNSRANRIIKKHWNTTTFTGK